MRGCITARARLSRTRLAPAEQRDERVEVPHMVTSPVLRLRL